MSLLYIGQQITIYGGICLVIAGIIGNGMNIFIFSTVQRYRKTPCTFYFLIGSICNIAYISINLISRVIATGYSIDLTRTSAIWCKIRQFLLVTLCLIAVNCSCLATIDQYFVTSQNARLRRLSNIKWTHRITIIMIIVWCLHGLPVFVYYDISSVTKACMNIDYTYGIYSLFYLFGLVTAIPILIMILFAYLTYRNIQKTVVLAQQQADRQLVRMVFVQIILIIIAFVPFGVNTAYQLITSGVSKDTDRTMKETFALTIFTLLPYLYYAGSCYMFLISSSQFRRVITNQLLFCFKNNQINPFDHRPSRTATLGNRTKN